MSTKEYLDKLNIDQLYFAIEYANDRIKAITEVAKEEYWLVSDSWMNVGYFKDKEKALKCFVEEFESDTSYADLSLSLVKRRLDEVEGLVKG